MIQIKTPVDWVIHCWQPWVALNHLKHHFNVNDRDDGDAVDDGDVDDDDDDDTDDDDAVGDGDVDNDDDEGHLDAPQGHCESDPLQTLVQLFCLKKNDHVDPIHGIAWRLTPKKLDHL